MASAPNRSSHESAILDDHLYLFDGVDTRRIAVRRDEIWVMKLGEEMDKTIG